MKVNHRIWLKMLAFWLLSCLLVNCQNTEHSALNNQNTAEKANQKESKSHKQLDKKRAVQEITRQVAIRVFHKLASDTLESYAPLAKNLAGTTLREIALESPSHSLSNKIDSLVNKDDFKGTRKNLRTLEERLNNITDTKNFKVQAKQAILNWQNDLNTKKKYYGSENIPVNLILSVPSVTVFLPDEISNDNLQEQVVSLQKQLTEKDTIISELKRKLNSKGNSINELLAFLLGAIVTLGVAFLFWFRPKQALALTWKKVSDKVRVKGFKLTPFYPDSGLLKAEQLLDLIENHKQPLDDTLNKLSALNTINPDGAIVKELRELLGDGNLVETVRGLKEEVQISATQKQQLESQLAQIKKAAIDTTTTTTHQSSQSQLKTFAYFSQPNPEGWFDDNERSDHPNSSTCYRFTFLNKGSVTATFNVEADPERMPRILNYRDRFLDPACENQNNYQTGHSRVVTLHDGKARLSNGQWRVETKAQIRFE